MARKNDGMKGSKMLMGGSERREAEVEESKRQTECTKVTPFTAR